jgi:hypothetical protein
MAKFVVNGLYMSMSEFNGDYMVAFKWKVSMWHHLS